MTQWTRADFIDLADAIRTSFSYDELVQEIIELCRERNSRFDEDRFRDRAGLGDKR